MADFQNPGQGGHLSKDPEVRSCEAEKDKQGKNWKGRKASSNGMEGVGRVGDGKREVRRVEKG